MKILYDHQIFCSQDRGGISRYFYELMKNQAALRPDVNASVFLGTNRNEYLKDLAFKGRIRGPNIHVKRAIRGLNSLNDMMWSAWSKTESSDIYHATYYRRLPAPPGARRIITVYDFIPERFSDGSSRSVEFINTKRKTIESCDFAICISKATQLDLLTYTKLPRDKTAVVYLGCDAIFNNRGGPSERIILYVGSRGGYKNYELLRRAYGQDARIWKNFRLVCFGGGPLLPCEHPENGSIEQLSGSDELLASYYRRAAVFVYPSLYEGFGLPILEALASSCPVITTKGGSLEEVGGSCVSYISGGDVDELIGQIHHVLDMERSLTACPGVTSHMSQFTWGKCCMETYEIYQRVAVG